MYNIPDGVFTSFDYQKRQDELVIGNEYKVSYVSFGGVWLGIEGVKNCYKINHFEKICNA